MSVSGAGGNSDHLNVEITADAEQAAAGYERIAAAGQKLAQSVLDAGAAGQTAGDQVTAGSEAAAKAMQEATTAATSFAESLEAASRAASLSLEGLTTAAKTAAGQIQSLGNVASSSFQAFEASAKDAAEAMNMAAVAAFDLAKGIQASVGAASKTMADLEKSSQAAGQRVQQVGRSAKEGEDGMKGLATQVYFASFGFGVLGPQIGEAAAMASNFFQVTESFKELTPMVLGTLGGLTALVLAFEGLTEAVSAYAKQQDQLVSVDALIKNQGGAYRELSEEAVKYADALSKASPFGKGEILAGFQQFLVSGVSVNDTLRSITAAMDLAKAKGESLSQASKELANAYNGQLGPLKDLGIVTADEAKNGLAWETVLQHLETRLGGTSAAAAQTFSGVLAQVGHSAEEAAASLGQALTPAIEAYLTGYGNIVRDAVKYAQENLAQFVSEHKEALDRIAIFFEDLGAIVLPTLRIAYDAIVATVEIAMDVIIGAMAVAVDLLAGNWEDLGKDLGSTSDAIGHSIEGSFGNLFENLGTIFNVEGQNIVTIFRNMTSNLDVIADNAGKGLQARLGQIGKAARDVATGNFGALAGDGAALAGQAGPGLLAGTDLTRGTLPVPRLAATTDAFSALAGEFRRRGVASPTNPSSASTRSVPGSSSGGAGDNFFEPAPSDKQFGPDKYEQEQKAALERVQSLTSGENALKIAVEVATTAQDRYNASLAYETKVQDDARAALAVLTATRDVEKKQLDDLEATLAKQTATAIDAQNAYEALRTKLAGQKNKAITPEERQELTQLKQTLDTASAAYELTSKRVNELRGFVDANNRSIQEEIAKTQQVAEAEAKRALAYNTAITAARESAAQERATYNASIEDQIAYYNQRLAQTQGKSDEEYALRQTFATKIIQLEEQEYKDRADLLKQFQQQQLDEALYSAQQSDATNNALGVGAASTANQRAFISARLNEYIAAGQQYSETAQSLAKQLLALDETDYKAREDAHTKFLQSWNDGESSLIGEILANHQNLRGDLKGIWDGIVGDFLKMIEKMIIESTLVRGIVTPFQNAFATLFNAGAPAGGSSGAFGALSAVTGGSGATGAGGLGILGALLPGIGGGGASGGGGVISGTIANSVFSAFAGQGARGAIVSLDQPSLTALTGSAAASVGGVYPSALGALGGFGGGFGGTTSGGYAGAVAAAAAAGGTVGAGGAGAGLGSLGGFGSLFNTSGFGAHIGALGGTTVGSAALAAAGGALAGSLLAGVTGGNQGNSSIGGAIGSVAGSALGPLGSVAGAVVGSVIGGMFGSHATAKTSPDIFNTQQYGQIVADLAGGKNPDGSQYSANGQAFNLEDSVSQITGGKTGIDFIEQTLANGKPSWMSQSDYDYFASLFGTKTGGSLGFEKNIGQQFVKGSNATPGDHSYTELGTALQKFLTEYSAGATADAANATTPTFKLTREYGDYQASILRDANGQLLQINGPTGSSKFTTQTGGGFGSVTVPAPLPASGGVQVNMQGSTIVGPGGADQAAQLISQSLRKIDQGLAPSASRRAYGDAGY